MLFEDIYIKLLNSIYKIVEKINCRLRKFFLFICSFMLNYSYMIKISNNNKIMGLSRDSIIFVLLISMIIFSIYDYQKRVKFNMQIMIPYYISTFGIFIIGIWKQTIGSYYLLAFYMLVFFPMFFLIISNSRDNELYKSIAYSTTLFTNIYYLYCFYLAKKGGLNFYSGGLSATASNRNCFAFFLLCAFASSIYIILISKNDIKKTIYGDISLSVSITLIIMTLCRTAFIVVIISILAAFIFVYNQFNLKCNKKKRKNAFKKIVLCTILFGIIFSSGKIMANIQNRHSTNNIQDIGISSLINRFDAKSNNNYSTGRLVIWKVYLKNMNLTGHYFGELTDEDFYPRPSLEEPHNNYIDISYKFGLITGFFYTLWIFEIGIIVIKSVFTKSSLDSSFIFSILFFIAFVFVSMLDVCVTPYTTNLVIYFYLAIAKLIQYN